LFEPDGNQPPRVPDRPSGLTSGRVGVECTYSSVSSDVDDTVVYYLFDWGDGTTSPWVKQQDNGDGVATHTWTVQGAYEVKVKAKDIYGRESNWSESLPITMPYAYQPIPQFFEWLFQRFPTMFLVLRQLLGDYESPLFFII